MSLTLDEIVEHEERLRAEIIERKCLLAAFNVLHTHAANGDVPQSAGLSSLVSALMLPAAAEVRSTERTASLPTPPPALPPIPPVPPYMHPELRALRDEWGVNHGKIVWWAIERMTDDYSLRDIAALLKREGYNMGSPEISVVLTRLKSRGRIEEVKRGSGPIPAVFRKPENVTAPVTKSTEMNGTTPAIESSVAV